ncbi:MAG: DUF2017 family protein [Actinomycetes bacterium]
MSDYRFEDPDTELSLRLSAVEADAIVGLARSVRIVLDAPLPPAGDEAARDRLFPRAYLDPTEDAAELAFQAAVHADLAAGRIDAIDGLIADLEGAERPRDGVRVLLTAERAGHWLGALNDLRLTLGTRIGVADDEPEYRGTVAADAGEVGLYHWLTGLQEALISHLLV